MHAVPKVDVRLVTPDRTSDLVVRDEIAGALDQRLSTSAGCGSRRVVVWSRRTSPVAALNVVPPTNLDVSMSVLTFGARVPFRVSRASEGENLPQQLWEHRTDRIGQRDIGDVVERRRLRVDDDERRAGRFCRGNERRHGIDLKTVPTAITQSASDAARVARSITRGASGCPNDTVSLLRIPPQLRHGGSSSPARTRSRTTAMPIRSPQLRHIA